MNSKKFLDASGITELTKKLDNRYVTPSELETAVCLVEDLIPTKTSQLTNDSKFITNSSIPTKLSQLANDCDFITSSQVDDNSGFKDLLGVASGNDVLIKLQTLTTLDPFYDKPIISFPYEAERTHPDMHITLSVAANNIFTTNELHVTAMIAGSIYGGKGLTIGVDGNDYSSIFKLSSISFDESGYTMVLLGTSPFALKMSRIMSGASFTKEKMTIFLDTSDMEASLVISDASDVPDYKFYEAFGLSSSDSRKIINKDEITSETIMVFSSLEDIPDIYDSKYNVTCEFENLIQDEETSVIRLMWYHPKVRWTLSLAPMFDDDGNMSFHMVWYTTDYNCFSGGYFITINNVQDFLQAMINEDLQTGILFNPYILQYDDNNNQSNLAFIDQIDYDTLTFVWSNSFNRYTYSGTTNEWTVVPISSGGSDAPTEQTLQSAMVIIGLDGSIGFTDPLALYQPLDDGAYTFIVNKIQNEGVTISLGDWRNYNFATFKGLNADGSVVWENSNYRWTLSTASEFTVEETGFVTASDVNSLIENYISGLNATEEEY